MSEAQGVFAATREGRTLNEIYGLGLGNVTGQYAWPYAGCSARLSKNGIYSPLPPIEAVRLCKIYCNRKRKLDGKGNVDQEFSDISRFPITTTCEQQCEEIGNSYERALNDSIEDIEGYAPPISYSQPWILIPLAFFLTAIIGLAIFYTPLPRIPLTDLGHNTCDSCI